ncbi:IclR family transcriptional regulator [Pseudoclavibacter endophyticus]|uniref:IclR family transcriptional regulator domain-containing protein n=1 Tax=Pseudoclavibacter endophyticus TaxID=1778590 RepID=UPI00199CEFF3|nr:IclR family transcriptional regulator C-terminal domain-containing protein [Pseudoclavibacter endophyticus]GGA69468.1 IclR family transcriptional regulator [Pseudoclavibacter endophyticus]
MKEPRDVDDRDYVQSLERGLAVIQAFADHGPELSLTETAQATGLSRPTARRLLLTLTSLGYVRVSGRKYSLTPRVLSIGYAYANSLDLTALAQPVMERVVSEAREACTLAALDGEDIVYLNRVSTRRLAHLTLAVGTRLPAYASAMGQVLLADLSPTDLDRYVSATELSPLTPRTIRTEQALRERLDDVRRRGYAQADQELEEGIRAVAVPVRGTDGRVFAALGISSTAVELDELCSRHLELLLDSAHELSVHLGSEYSAS